MPPSKTPRRSGRGPTPRKTARPRSTPTSDDDGSQRLQKVMAACGVGSRRHCEELITTGRVEVDRQVVTELGVKVDPDAQEIRVDGTVLSHARKVYYLVYKPVGVVSTNHDPSGRPRVIDLLPSAKERLFTVGRLDISSEGLILLTNDGALANQLAHPRYGVEKTYHALVAGTPSREVLASLRKGVHLAEGIAGVVSVRIKKEMKGSTLLEIVLAEGKNREIRRILAKVGHKVMRLKRVAIGPIKLREMPIGSARRLKSEEVEALRRSASPKRRRSSRPATGDEAVAADTQGPDTDADAPLSPPLMRPAKKAAASGPVVVHYDDDADSFDEDAPLESWVFDPSAASSSAAVIGWDDDEVVDQDDDGDDQESFDEAPEEASPPRRRRPNRGQRPSGGGRYDNRVAGDRAPGTKPGSGKKKTAYGAKSSGSKSAGAGRSGVKSTGGGKSSGPGKSGGGVKSTGGGRSTSRGKKSTGGKPRSSGKSGAGGGRGFNPRGGGKKKGKR